MARRVPFRQADVARALRGARDAGLNVTRIEIAQDGRITMVAGDDAPDVADESNPWDKVLEDATDQERPA